MPTTMIEIATPDGPCAVELATPGGRGPWRAVIACFDGGGHRPAMTRIAEGIAKMGYLVVQPNLFHRAPPLGELVGGPVTYAAMKGVFADPDRRAKFFADYYAPAIDYQNLTSTIGAVLAHLATRSDVAPGPVGTTGYCMGGNASVRIATLFGERVAATAAFHPGGLVNDQPDSPHRRLGGVRSRLYIGPAIGDLEGDAEQTFLAAMAAANVRGTVEQYAARHGYAMDDFDVYDAACAARHFAALEALYAETLR